MLKRIKNATCHGRIKTMTNSVFEYVTYIETTPEKLWDAFTNGDITEQYFFGTRIESQWNEGAEVTYSRNGEVTDYGIVLKYKPYQFVSFTWQYVKDTTQRKEPTQVSFELIPLKDTVKLILRHENLLEQDFNDDKHTFEGFNNGWPAILSNLKSYLETGKTLSGISI
jgi:uncharacterized protein YndB with AHSA1/START domain